MKDTRRLMLGGAIALAGMLLLSGPVLAQNQGPKQGAGQTDQGQLCTGGPGGTCAVTPPKNPGNSNCPGYGTGNQQRRGPMGRGMGRGGGRFNQPDTQTNPPATNK